MFEGLKKKLSEAVKSLIKEETHSEKQDEASPSEPKPMLADENKPTAHNRDTVPMHTTTESVPIMNKESVRSETHIAESEAWQKKHDGSVEKRAESKENTSRKKDLVKLSLKTKLKSVFSSTIVLNKEEIADFAENIRISLLQSDVSYDTADAFIEDLKERLGNAKLDRSNLRGGLTDEVRSALFDVLNGTKSGIDIVQAIKEKNGAEPIKILFLGPNGTGKTTTMAKIAHKLKKEGLTCVISASDTFRAAAIEQTEHHAKMVGVPVIKSKYGADPASIAFDAVSYARSHALSAVLIDTAGRQQTNKNLIHEMEKMVRVAKPDITLFVGESTAGNQLSEQVKEFLKYIKIDGIILTKLDCDAKGGNAISIAHATGVPLVYLGTGESYDAIVKYTPEFIVDAIIPGN